LHSYSIALSQEEEERREVAHKDSMTGVMVADLFEVITPMQLVEVFVAMDADSRRHEKHLRRKSAAKKVIDEEISLQNEYCEEEDRLPAVEKVVKVLETKSSQSFDGNKYSIKAVVIAGGMYQLVESWQLRYYGNMWEPPDGDGEVTMTSLRGVLLVQEVGSIQKEGD